MTWAGARDQSRRHPSHRSAPTCTARPVICAALVSAALLASCSGKPPASDASSGGAVAGADSAGAPASLGKATFSVQVDGQSVSGGAIGSLQLQNAAYTVPSGSGAPTLLFYLADTKTPTDTAPSHLFRFDIPKSEGLVTPTNVSLTINLDPSHMAKYSTSKATVTITGLTAQRVSGTFSGTLDHSSDTPNVPKATVAITDGKFDIPMATSKMIPP